jgi:DNA (cytosine-5)-methyltransferase 1
MKKSIKKLLSIVFVLVMLVSIFAIDSTAAEKIQITESEPNDSMLHATPINQDCTVSGKIYGNDKDYFLLSFETDRKVYISTTCEYTYLICGIYNAEGKCVSGGLFIYNNQGAPLYIVDDTLPAGLYYFVLFHNSGQTADNDYVFTLETAEGVAHVHSYDNKCDTMCNECGETRYTMHIYDNRCDTTCNECGHKYNPMKLDVEHRYICPNCGSDDIKGTRSGLLLEVERLLIKSIETNTAPKYLCLENVKNLVGTQFKPDFDAWVKRLEHLGYNTYWKVLNAKECAVPQNRERVFAFSIRKDIDTTKFTFPAPFDNGLRLKDILEPMVDEKYYINTERANNLIQQLIDKGYLNAKSILERNQATEVTKPVDVANTLMARDWKGYGNQEMIAIVESQNVDVAERIGGMFDGDTRHQAGSVWNTNGLAPTLDTMQGGLRQPCIVEDTAKPIRVGNTTPSGKSQCNAVYSTEGVSQTLCAGTHGYATGSILEKHECIYRIRKLTPRECFKLMGFEFSDWDKCVVLGVSNTAGYKAAGNSIVTNCISLIFEHLYKAQYNEWHICTDENPTNFIQPQVVV